MKKILVFLFSLICLVAYPQRKNEYGLKMVKSITSYEYMGADKGMGYRYEFNYDENNRSTSSKLYIKQKNSDDFGLFETYILKNGELIHHEMYWADNKLIRDEKQYILNDKGHLVQRIQIFPGEKEVWNYIYDKDASIYDENLVAVEYIETDRNGNFFTGPLGNTVKPLVGKIEYGKPTKGYDEYEDMNDTNISLQEIIRSGYTDLLYISTWIPQYNPYIPIRWKKEPQIWKYEYFYDENESISKIMIYILENDVYKLKRKIEIEYYY